MTGENLQSIMQERLPQEYEKCMSGINRVLQLTWEIAEKPTEDKTRLQAFAQLNEGYKFKMDLTTNGVNSAIGRLYFGAIFPLILRHHGTLAQILLAI
jgi:hypothetical protein